LIEIEVDLEDQSNFKVHIDEMKYGDVRIIYVFNFTIRSFVFHVGRWNSTFKTYNQKNSIKNKNFNTNNLRNFMLKNHLYKARRGGGGGGGVGGGW
jgi:hypothetical protein